MSKGMANKWAETFRKRHIISKAELRSQRHKAKREKAAKRRFLRKTAGGDLQKLELINRFIETNGY